MIAVNPIIECFWRDLVPKYCQGVQSSAVYTGPPFFVDSVHGRPYWSLPCVLLHLHAEDMVPTILTLIIYIGICLPTALTLTRLWLYEMFEVLRFISMNSMGLWGLLSFCVLKDAFPYPLGRWIPFKEGVPYHLQSKIRTPPAHLRWTILALQIVLNAWISPWLVHSKSQ